MIGALGQPEPISGWLRASEREIGLHQDVMSSMYDLDGGIAAGQWGLVAHSCRDLVRHATLLALGARRVSVPAHRRREREWLIAIDLLERTAPELAREAWGIYLAPGGDEEAVREQCRDTIAFVDRCTGSAGLASPAGFLLRWAEAANEFRATCTALSIPISDDWYLTRPGGDWYEDVLGWAGSQGGEGPPPTGTDGAGRI